MKKILKHTWLVLDRNEKRKFLLLTLSDILVSLADILFLVALLWIVRFYIEPTGNGNAELLPGWLADKQQPWLIAVFFLLFSLKNICAYWLSAAHFRFIGSVATRISQHNLLHYQNAGFDNFINVDSSVHIRKICFQPFEFCQYILAGIQQIITQVCLVSLAIAAILLFNAELFLLLFCVLLPPVVLIFYFVKKKLDAVKKNIRSANERSFRHLLDALKGYVESNIYGRNTFFENRFVRQRALFSKNLFTSLSLQSLPPRVMEAFAVLGLFALISIAIWTGDTNSAAFITIGAFIAAAYKIIPGVVRIINARGQINAYEFALAELLAEGDLKNDIPAGKQPIHSVSLENISFGYTAKEMLTDISIHLQPGDFIGLTGRSGLGKTTLLNILLGFLHPDAGTVKINNRAISTENIKTYWPGISYVRQQNFLIHGSIVQNITFSESEADQSRLQQAITVTGLDLFLATEPEGIEKEIMENGKNISGGQQQRIAMARAIYHDADLYLLDEPMSELDEGSAGRILSHLQALAGSGKMILMITHDKRSLAYCNKVIALDD